MDLHSNVRHQHFFNNARRLRGLASGDIPTAEFCHVLRGWPHGDRGSTRETSIIMQQSYGWNGDL